MDLLIKDLRFGIRSLLKRPGFTAIAVLTLALSLNDMQRLIPGTWLLLYGCAVVAASTATNSKSQPIVASMGALFILLGGAAFALPASR